MPNMLLKAATNAVGSQCETDLGVTKKEWDAMSEKERQDLISEFQSDVVEIWVQPEDE